MVLQNGKELVCSVRFREEYPLYILRPSMWNIRANYMYYLCRMGMDWDRFFLLYLIKYRANDAKDNIADIVLYFFSKAYQVDLNL